MPIVVQSQLSKGKSLLNSMWADSNVQATDELRMPAAPTKVSLDNNIPIRSVNSNIKEYLSANTLVTENTKLVLTSNIVSIERLENKQGDKGIVAAVYRIVANSKDGNNTVSLGPDIIIQHANSNTFEERKKNILSSVLGSLVEIPPLIISANKGKDSVLAVTANIDSRLYELLKEGFNVKHEERISSIGKAYTDKFVVVDSNGQKSDPIYRYSESVTADNRMKQAIVTEIAKLKGDKDSSYVQNPPAVTDKWTVLLEPDSGNNFCSKILSSAALKAEYDPQTSILRNTNNEPLCGFIHIPKDEYSEKPLREKNTEELLLRHESTIELLSAAIRGYVNESLRLKPELPNVKILLGGFSQFSNVSDNSTGEFAKTAILTEEALSKAFPDYKLISLESRLLDDTNKSIVSRIVLQEKLSDKQISCYLMGREFDVNNTSIDDSKKSVQYAIDNLKPNAVILLGSSVLNYVDSKYKIYNVPSIISNFSSNTENSNNNNSLIIPENYSLSRAISEGHKILTNINSETK